MLFGNASSAVEWLGGGLGNPGQKYANTRHNMGFLTVDLLAEEAGVQLNKVKFKSAYNILRFAGTRCLVMKPQTYMNSSGESIRAAADYYKVDPEDILIVYDDISLAPGQLRIRAKGSAGGHNGLKNIIYLLGRDDFARVKLGVGEKPHPDYDLADWVLGRFTKEQGEALEQACSHCDDIVRLFVAGRLDEAMNRYNS